MLILGWDVDQHVFNVDSTLAFQHWICNVDSMLNIDCVELTTWIQRWIYLIYINLYTSQHDFHDAIKKCNMISIQNM